MNRSGKITIWLGLGLALAATLRADDTQLPGDPYNTVVERNIFGLNPPPPPGPAVSADPPPKITPNGIMNILGDLQVLFKVAGTPKPGGQATADVPYILSKGQRQDDIEVVDIDDKNSIVTFNNHGEVQTLPLVVTMPSSTPAPGAPGAGGAPGGPGGRFAPGVVNPGFGADGRRHGGGVAVGGGGSTGNGVNPGANPGGQGNIGNPIDGSNLRAVPTRSGGQIASSQIPEGMTPEQQIVGMELSREIHRQQGEPTGGLIPPTDVTPNDATGPTGNPLVTPPSGPGNPQ